ncbi:MAG: GNAT family protein [Sneathiella sp.]
MNREDLIYGDRIYLRQPKRSDWEQWTKIRDVSREHLIPWEPVWSNETLTRRSFRERLLRFTDDAKSDTGYAFFLFRKEDDQLVGSITLSNVRRGVAQTGTLGYWTGLPYIRNGYMFEGICALLPALFDKYSLRRVEAACLPENMPSASLLEKAGFKREGVAREYLCINGKWQDHLLFAILNSDAIGNTNGRTQPSGVANISR